MPTKQAPEEFVEKVKAKMNAENLSVRSLAKILGVSHPTITEFVTHGNRPSVDTCIALAHWLGQSDISILREAGWLKPGPPDEARFEDWKFLLDQMPADEQEEMHQIALMKIEKRKKAELAARTANFKPGTQRK